jgi:hypothetical protein
MSTYPTAIDNDVTLPPVNNNLTQVGEEAINSLRDAVFNIETALGTNIAGTSPSLAARLGVAILPDGGLNPSVLTALRLVTLPIYNCQIAATAGIQESKLDLDYPTANLFNYIRDLSQGVNIAVGWINVSGVKLEPHLMGSIYRHNMTQIDVIETSANYLNNVFHANRDNINAFLLANDMNNELVSHQWADGSPVPYATADGSLITAVNNIITNSGSFYPSNYAHTAAGIYINTSGFIAIPPTTNSVQELADYIDNTSILLLGSRIQNLYANGISVNSRSSSLTLDGYGSAVVPFTTAIAYLGGQYGNFNAPFDSYQYGDDLIQLMPTSSQMDGYTFDAQFGLVRTGDIISVGYAGDGYNVSVRYVILEKKYVDVPGNESYFIRIAGKNLFYAPNVTIRIDRTLFNNNKYGVLSVASGMPTNSSNGSLLAATPSLIIGNPDGAQCAGVGFNPDQFDNKHYLLYLILYPDGNPLDGAIILPGIDVTGNMGQTPGAYTLESIVQATNNAFRQPGFNFRFTAFQFQGEFGIILDPYNNSSFSVISCGVTSGAYNHSLALSNNVIDVFPASGATVAPDPLGFGPNGSGVASPPFSTTYDSSQSASGFPTQVFTALQSNNYYVNGAERSTLATDVLQSTDIYGDGYWVATIDGYTVGSPGQVSVTYNIPLDLQPSLLKIGKTIVVQPYGTNLGFINYGRFVISNVTFSGCPISLCQITVFDAVHAVGSSPQTVAPVGSQVCIYFSSDSVSFDNETATDDSNSLFNSPFKRHFEIYTDYNGNTYTHERARMPIGGSVTVNDGFILAGSHPSLAQIDIVAISPTLRGSQSGSTNYTKLHFTSLDIVTGLFSGYMQGDGAQGPTTNGVIGDVTRFYDASYIDYIDIIFEFNNPLINDITYTSSISFQLFPSLALDQEVMLIGSCQENTSTNAISQIQDLREFGNISQEQLTTSALNYISAGDQALHFNGIIRGFDANVLSVTGVTYGMISVDGGVALVNGSLESINPQSFIIPAIQEIYNSFSYYLNYVLCVNSDGELVTIVMTDYDTYETLVTPNVGVRIVNVENVVYPTNPTYQVDSSLFSDILNNRKDLTALYIVTSFVSGVGSAATTQLILRDVRRFVNDADSSIPVVITDGYSQGNFQSFTSAAHWLLFNSNYQNTMVIKGLRTLSSSVPIPAGLQIIGGSTNATLSLSAPLTFTNVTFSDLTIVINATMTVANVNFINCVIQVNTAQGLALQSGTLFDNCNFTYNFNPSAGYNHSDLVNAGNGMIYAAVGAATFETLSDVSIINCTFQNNFSDYFPFISVELFDVLAVASNIIISDNTFISNTTEDQRAVIAFNSAIVNGFTGNTFPYDPKLADIIIENNSCNQSQMIIISGTPTNNYYMSNICLTCTSCIIDNNVCGTIGFFTASNDTLDITHFSSALRNQFDTLTISNNTCHYIGNLDITGHWIEFFSVPDSNIETVTVSTGQVDIIGNTVSWIHAGAWSASTDLGGSVRIIDNKINPMNYSYLSKYANGFGDTPDNIGIYLLQDTPTVGNSQNVISGNSIIQNWSYTTTGAQAGPYYYAFGICCSNNAQVTNNNVFGVINANLTGEACILLVGNAGANYIVQNNNLNRQGLPIAAYILAYPGIANSAVITDNIFDSIYVSGTTTNDIGNNIPNTWTYLRNKNQVNYAVIQLVEGLSQGGIGDGIIPNFYTLNYPDGYTAVFIGVPPAHVVWGGPINNITVEATATGGTLLRNINFSCDLGSKLPDGVSILATKQGVVSLSGFSNTGVGTFTAQSFLFSQDTNFVNVSFNTATGTVACNNILDPNWGYNSSNVDTSQVSNSLSWNLSGGGGFGTTEYLTITITADNFFHVTTTKNIMYDINLVITMTAGVQDFTLSPLVVQYSW